MNPNQKTVVILVAFVLFMMFISGRGPAKLAVAILALPFRIVFGGFLRRGRR